MSELDPSRVKFRRLVDCRPEDDRKGVKEKEKEDKAVRAERALLMAEAYDKGFDLFHLGQLSPDDTADYLSEGERPPLPNGGPGHPDRLRDLIDK